MKVCKHCGTLKPLGAFKIDLRKKSGRGAECKACANERNVAYNATAAAKSKRNKAYKKRIACAEYRAALAEYHLWYRSTDAGRQIRGTYESRRRAVDPLFKLKRGVRNLIKESVRNFGGKRGSKTERILGCSIRFFSEYIESKFVPGMGWDNREEWSIDHIVPCNSAVDYSGVLQLNRYTNFQPMWRRYNIIKSDMMPDEWEQYCEINNINVKEKP